MSHASTSDSNARVQRTRVDPSHVTRNTHSTDSHRPDLDSLAAIAGRNPERLPEQMQRQSDYLRNQLQTQQRELDRREAEFNARAARMENELRTARLIYRERELALQEKQDEFQRCLSGCRDDQADGEISRSVVQRQVSDPLDFDATDLDHRRSRELSESPDEIEDRERRLQVQLENVVASQQRAGQLVGELRAELDDGSPPQLGSEDYHQQLTNRNLTDQKQEIVELIRRLEKHTETLSEQREELRGWVARRQSEMEAQAGRRLHREREIGLETVDLQHIQKAWKRQRLEMEREIHRLESMLHPHGISATSD